MLDTLLIIILQSWGQCRRSGRPPGPEGEEEHVIVRMTDEEAAEILRVLNTFSGMVATSDPQT